uniref:JAB domain-containing protein n=1 Tax=Lachnoclostridium phocaeense TaxID=1871021 RepID=UPI0026DBA987|nr:JAB domain-containing protein [Lachnoclostridium phocaeense]
MRVTNYTVKTDDEKRLILVKENATNYSALSMLTQPNEVVCFMNDLYDMQHLAEEYMYMIATTTKGRPLGVFEVSHGTATATFVSPREIMIRLLLVGAVAFLLVHNHPSGCVTPSENDILFTKRINEAGRILNLTLSDHLIIGDNGAFCSMRQDGLLI